MTEELYEVQNIAVNLSSDDLKLDEQKQPRKISKANCCYKENTNNKTNQIVEEDNSVSKNDSG